MERPAQGMSGISLEFHLSVLPTASISKFLEHDRKEKGCFRAAKKQKKCSPIEKFIGISDFFQFWGDDFKNHWYAGMVSSLVFIVELLGLIEVDFLYCENS